MFLNDWKEDGKFKMVADFEGLWIEKVKPNYMTEDRWLKLNNDLEIKLKKYEEFDIILASYTYENYSGDAFVLFEHDGKLYEVNGGHCSCYGLEGQWSPEETTIEALKHRIEKGSLGTGYGLNEFKNELEQVLNDLEKVSTQ